MATVRESLQSAKSQFRSSGINEVDAEILLANILGLTRMELHNSVVLEQRLKDFADLDDLFDQFAMATQRRLKNEPVQYITGTAPFHKISLIVGPGVLIPRPETELLVEAVLQHIQNYAHEKGKISVIDLGAGSGAIAIAIASEAPQAHVVAVESDPLALEYLKKNVEANDGQVRIIHEDISSALTGVKADIVVANPPYIPNNQSLPQDVELFEPHFALFGGPTGMEIPTKFIAAGSRLLKSGGLFLMEHGEEQGAPIHDLLARDFENIRLHLDLTERPRWTSAVRKSS